MAEYEELKGFRKWVADRLKLNPAQPSIASLEPYASPETINFMAKYGRGLI